MIRTLAMTMTMTLQAISRTTRSFQLKALLIQGR
jgi:hypothetical protein